MKIIGSDVYLKKGDYESALKDAEEAIKLTASSDPPAIETIYKQKSSILWEMGKPEASIRFLEKCPQTEEVKSILKSFKEQYGKECGLSYDDPVMGKIEKFIDWMKENGAKFNKIRMRYYGPDYRGVHSVTSIDEDEVFLWVPRKLIITSQMGKDTKIGTKIKDSEVSISWDYLVYITVFLLVQQYDENSWWKPYMDVYPKTVNSFPIFFSEEEKKLLQGSPMYDQIGTEIAEIKEEYNKIVKAVPEFSMFPFEAYIRNKTLVISRIFYVTINGVIERIMVPLAGIFLKITIQICSIIITKKSDKHIGDMMMLNLPLL